MRLKFQWTLPLFTMAILTACGSDDPQGKFVDEKKVGGKDSGSDARYLRFNAPDKFEADWSKENSVVFHWRGEPDNLHPTNGASGPRRMVMDYTQRFIVAVDYEKLELRPDLVVSMPQVSEDGLTYTYELRPEPKWDDGSPLTVDDVIFSLKVNKCPLTNNPHAKSYFEYLKAIEKDGTNPRKFRLIMTQKYIQNVAFLGDVPIMQASYFDKNNVMSKYTLEQFNDPAFSKTSHPDLEAWAKEYNDPKYGRDIAYLRGLGPYKVTAWEDKQRLELTRKENHWTSNLSNAGKYDASFPDKIIFRVISDENAIALELKNQTIDVSAWISTHGLYELQKDPAFNRNYHSAFVNNFNYQYIGMNMKPEAVNRTPFFSDKKVRKAMAHLVPVDQLNQSYLDGKAVRMTSLVPPTKPHIYDQSLKPVPFDIDAAKKLLDEAGWKDTDGDNVRDKMINGKKVPFEFELLIMTGNTTSENMAKDIKESMYKAGVVVNIRSLEFVTFYEQVKLHEYDMYFGAWAGNFSNDDYKQIWHTSSWASGGSNYVGFGTPQTDALIDSIRVTINDSARRPMEKRLQQIVYDEQPYVFLFMVPTKIAIHKRFDNAEMYWERPGVYLSWLKLMGTGTKPVNSSTP